MIKNKAYKLERDSNINMFPGDSQESPDESFSKETLKIKKHKVGADNALN